MIKAGVVVYVDPKGAEHKALVTAVNPLNPGYITLVIVDDKADEASNVKKLYDVRHMDEIAEQNPALPTYQLHCWKEVGDVHNAPPADHAIFDHPQESAVRNESGERIHKARPEFEAEVAEHQAAQAGDEPVKEEPKSNVRTIKGSKAK